MSIDSAFAYTLVNEGGFSNSKFDSGGCTKYGITMATLSRYRGRPVTPMDVGLLGEDEAKRIYAQLYWTPLLLDELTDQNIATCIFDIAVLRGPGTSVSYAQKAINQCSPSIQVMVDYRMGPATIAAINATQRFLFIPSFQGFVRQDIDAIVQDNPSQKIFLSGWCARIDRLRTLV